MSFLLLIYVVGEAQCLISLGEWSHVFAYSFFVLHLTLTEVHFCILQSTLRRRHMSDMLFKYPPSVLLECMIIAGFFDNLGIRPRIIKSAD